MAWYWWVIIVVGGLILINMLRGKKAPPREDDMYAFVRARAAEEQEVDQVMAKVADIIGALFVSAPDPLFPSTLTQSELKKNVTNFMHGAGMTGLRTSTQMLHVVSSPVKITAVVKLQPTKPQVAVREFIRRSEEQWAFRTFSAEDMNSAIRAAEAESDRVVAEIKRNAGVGDAPTPAAGLAMQGARPEAGGQSNSDLTSAPLPRRLLNLFWLGPTYLQTLKDTVRGGYSNVSVIDASGGANAPEVELLKSVTADIVAGHVTERDIDWAIRVDAVAGRAEAAFHNGEALQAIEIFREALQQAPGCDNFLMSMGACYGALGAFPEALRYYERAAEISPENERIARNLAKVREVIASA